MKIIKTTTEKPPIGTLIKIISGGIGAYCANDITGVVISNDSIDYDGKNAHGMLRHENGLAVAGSDGKHYSININSAEIVILYTPEPILEP